MADASKKKRRQYTDEERAEILRDAERLGVAAAADKHGIAQSTVSNWRNRSARRAAEQAEPEPEPVAPTDKAVDEVQAAAATTTNKPRVARSYTPSEKARALECAAEHGVTKASEHFGISRFSLYEWRRKLKKAAAGEGPSPTSGPAPADIEQQRAQELLGEWRRHPGLGPSQVRDPLRRRGIKVAVAIRPARRC